MHFAYAVHRSCVYGISNHTISKILTSITSHFTSAYVFHWQQYLPSMKLAYPPTFDGRIVLYPSEKEVRDYFSWRQADSCVSATLHCSSRLTWFVKLTPSTSYRDSWFDDWHTAHINNLYNTTFWALVQQGGSSTADAHQRLKVCFWNNICVLPLNHCRVGDGFQGEEWNTVFTVWDQL